MSRKAVIALAALAEAGFTPAVNFALIPLLTTRFGISDYGGFALAQILSVVSATLALGIGTAITTSVAACADGDALAKRCHIDAAFAILLRLTAAFLIGGWCLAEILESFYGTRSEVLSFLGVMWAIGQLWENFYGAILKGESRFLAASTLEIAGKTLTFGAFVGATFVFSTLEEAMVILPLASFAAAFMKRTYVRATVMPQEMRILDNSREKNKILRFSAGVWLHGVGSLAFNSLDKVVLGIAFGSAVVGRYNVYVQIAALVHFVSANVFFLVIPKLSRIVGDHSDLYRADRYRKIIAKMVVVNSTFAIVFGLVIFTLSLFASSYLHIELLTAGQLPVLGMLLTAYVVLTLSTPYIYGVMAAGMTTSLGTANLVAALATLPCLLIAAHFRSIDGIAISRSLFGTLMLLFTYRLYQRASAQLCCTVDTQKKQ